MLTSEGRKGLDRARHAAAEARDPHAAVISAIDELEKLLHEAGEEIDRLKNEDAKARNMLLEHDVRLLPGESLEEGVRMLAERMKAR